MSVAVICFSTGLSSLRFRVTQNMVNIVFVIYGAAIAAQDHGFSPTGSNRVLRFALWEKTIARRPRVEELFYLADEIPEELTRLRAAATTLEGLWGISGSILQPGIAAPARANRRDLPAERQPVVQDPVRLRG
mgnify:CR=1 FL=1